MFERSPECIRSAYGRCGCFALEFLFAFQNRAGGGIDVIIVFIPAGKEFHLVYRLAVVDIKVGFHTACRGSGNARVFERSPECIRSAYGCCGCFALEFLFAFKHRAGGGIDVIIVFIPAGKEFHLVYCLAVVDIKVGFHLFCVGCRNARVLERDAECIRSAYGRCGCFALEFLFGLQHRAGGGIDVIIVFIPAGKEFHFVNHFAVLVIHLDFERFCRGSRNARVFKRKLRCPFGADICAVARGAGYIKPGFGFSRAA